MLCFLFDESIEVCELFVVIVQQIIDMVYSLHCPVSCKASFVQEQPSRHQFLCRHRWAVKVFWRVEDIQPKCKFVRYDTCEIFIA